MKIPVNFTLAEHLHVGALQHAAESENHRGAMHKEHSQERV